MTSIDNKNSTLSSMYKDWFLDYASYVILERAIPKVDDGLKPVQRRILHTLKEVHDGRYVKVANVIGRTMQYHPHGDQAITDALVKLGQKNLLIDMQGNWGDIRSGDKAAAARYIEARLSEFALDVVFNNNITKFQPSYDGRNKEPISLPVKFPLILAQGAEGIAVGLSTKILPHNFNELIKSSIAIIKEKSFQIFPDFLTGGMIDISNYNNGKKGGRVRVRSNIDIVDKFTLKISSLCYGVTTQSLIDSILKATNNGKIKVKKIEDNTAENVEIIIHLVKGTSHNMAIDALYAFTNCEISISPNCCVIVNNQPQFISVNELLRISTKNTKNLLKEDLIYNLSILDKKWHFVNLEKIFIENKIYRKIEDAKSFDEVIQIIDTNLEPYSNLLKNDISKDDIIKLTEIKIKRISKYNQTKQIEDISRIEHDIEETSNNINHIDEYTIRYFEQLLKKYGKENKRLTNIILFDSISARRVIQTNKKLYVNRENGFFGTSLKKHEFISKCSDLDYVLIFLKNGKYIVTKVQDKKYIGKDIIFIAVWKKNNKHMIYNLAYLDGLTKYVYVKRFSITAIQFDRIYDITQGSENSLILYLTANPNSESEVINVFLHSSVKIKNRVLEYDYNNLAIKGRGAKGNILTKLKVRKLNQKSIGESTLGGLDIWLDDSIGRLNTEKRGSYLGCFNSEDKIIVFYNDGSYSMTSFELSNRYNMNDIYEINKFDKNKIITLLYFNGKLKGYYVKRFLIETSTIDRKFPLISNSRGSKFILLSSESNLELMYFYRTKNSDKKSKTINLDEEFHIKNFKAIGKKLDSRLRMSGFKFIDNKSTKIDKDIEDTKNNELTLFS